ncbi:uncharacterized protein (TIGR02284 family) [Roseiarcus fermentans]|uniref:Uncharacterized protein (TIGR02284 family) n=1 Tax=Roseiarcus fermentans TaxID=1473586 RepID=A0A366FFV1_9HYPH|nr:PA2169 family four-helix-bundle protein [Roseiarcus fermentans]RBP12840.1 uncharacterized protein (TIGR02284 family) [Roseiarcus fermentans]
MNDHASVTSLYTALVDAKNGYGEAVKDAERADLKTLFQDMIALHERALAQLRPELEARGVEANDRGSFMTNVHETVIAVRSAVTGLDERSLAGFADGEERILKSYDAAIAESAGDAALAETLEQQRAALSAKVEGMKSAAERA